MNTRKRNLLFVLSSVLTLLPILLGFIMWDKLPGQMSTHWDASMVADSSVEGSSGKLFCGGCNAANPSCNKLDLSSNYI